MRRFLVLSVLAAGALGLYEVTQFFRPPSLDIWLDRSWFASGGILFALLFGSEDRKPIEFDPYDNPDGWE